MRSAWLIAVLKRSEVTAVASSGVVIAGVVIICYLPLESLSSFYWKVNTQPFGILKKFSWVFPLILSISTCFIIYFFFSFIMYKTVFSLWMWCSSSIFSPILSRTWLYTQYTIKMYLQKGGREGGKKTERRKRGRERGRKGLMLRSAFSCTEKNMHSGWNESGKGAREQSVFEWSGCPICTYVITLTMESWVFTYLNYFFKKTFHTHTHTYMVVLGSQQF